MFTKAITGLFAAATLVVAAVAFEGNDAKDCCTAKMSCCGKDKACCAAGAKLGCCDKCCSESRACCAAVQKCCSEGAACCDESKACCGKPAASSSAQGTKSCCDGQSCAVPLDSQPQS